MKKATFNKIAILALISASLASCSSPNLEDANINGGDPNFTNSHLTTADPNAKIYNGYSQNDLQNSFDTIYFAFDSYKPREEYLSLIQAQAEFIIKNNAKVLLTGYTDERGTPEYNITLGAERAKSVANLLISYGVNAVNIRQLSYGEEKPAVLGHSEQEYAKNRRVVFVYNF